MLFFDHLSIFLGDLNTNGAFDEWYMSSFVDKSIKTLTSYEAFDVLKQFAPFMIDNFNQQSEYEMIETLRYLKYQSDTNEKFYNDAQKHILLALYKTQHSQNLLSEIFNTPYHQN